MIFLFLFSFRHPYQKASRGLLHTNESNQFVRRFFAIKNRTLCECAKKRKSRTMCENYFGAFSLATIRRAFHYESIHKKEKNIEPQYREEKTEVLQTGAYISATKKTKIHTYYGLDHDYKAKNKTKNYILLFHFLYQF